MSRTVFQEAAVALVLLLVVGTASAQVLPNPYRQVESWASLPGGRTMGAVRRGGGGRPP